MTNYTLHCGDSVEYMATMPDNSVDLTVTSPPYDKLRTYGGYAFDYMATVESLFRITKPGGVVVWVVGDQTIDGNESGTSFRHALYAQQCGFSLETMIYSKNGMGACGPNHLYWQLFEYMFLFIKGKKPKTSNLLHDIPAKKPGKHNVTGRRSTDGFVGSERRIINNSMIRRSNVWLYDVGKGSCYTDDFARRHPAPFPEKLALDHILSWSNEGDMVFDPMMGSGTTGKMAIRSGRKFTGCDVNADYVAIAKQRIQAEAYTRQPSLLEVA